MIPAALRSRAPRLSCRLLFPQVRAQTTESSSSALESSDTKHDAPLDPRVQTQLRRMLRVDHAGEFAAVRIYQGQRMILGDSSDGPLLREMQDHEEAHLSGISEAARLHRADPSLLLPIWSAAALALGVGSALLGRKAAMACTQAVETVITQHYNDQLRELHALPPSSQVDALINTVKQYRDEEQSHHDIAVENGANSAPFHSILTGVISAGCSAAIKIAERI